MYISRVLVHLQPGFNTAAENVSPKLEVGDAIKRCKVIYDPLYAEYIVYPSLVTCGFLPKFYQVRFRAEGVQSIAGSAGKPEQ